MKTIHFILIIIFLFFSHLIFSQQNNVGINTTSPDPSAALEIVSKNNDQGILIPRLTTTQRNGITSPANGLMVYDSTTKTFWFFDGTNWVNIGAISIPTKIEDADMDTSLETIEGQGVATDEVNVNIDGNTKWKFIEDRLEAENINGNLFVGQVAGKDNTGSGNTFLGNGSGFKNTDGDSNTFVGRSSGSSNTSGDANTFIGQNSGIDNTIGIKNTFLGRYAGLDNTEGDQNIFVGYSTGTNITTGDNNLFLGNDIDLGSNVSNTLAIENNHFPGNAPLIYGEFDNDLFRVNGTLNINSAFSFPTTDGTANQVLATDGSGNVAWTTSSSGGSTSKIEDADMDTWVEAIDGSGATDLIEFTVDGISAWEMKKDRLEETNANDNIFIGKNTGNATTTATESVFVGTNAGISNATGNANVYLGKDAGASNVAGTTNVYVGHSSGSAGAGGSNNTFLGGQAGALVTGNNNTYVGQLAGGGASSDGEGNVFLGFNAGQFETGDNKLFIENSASPDPLIYGDFATDLLRINGTLNINQAFSFPTSDGVANQVLATDGSGNVAWTTTSSGGSSSKIEDADMDTSVEAIDGTGATDEIEFKVDNAVQWKMVKDRLEEGNNDSNIYIGDSSGGLNSSENNNTFIGSLSGSNPTTNFSNNTFIGSNSGLGMQRGGQNVVIGAFAGPSNVVFSDPDNASLKEGNIFIGYYAGVNEQSSNKLYIENSGSSTPLIYGEFDNDLLRINGTLNVNNAFSFPTTDGAANQVLATNGSGNVAWTTPSSGGSSSKIEDADMDTWVEAIDGSGATDIIQFVVDGDSHWKMVKDRIEEENSDGNIFIGQSTGNSNLPNPGTNEGIKNTFVGTTSGTSNSTGGANTFLGNSAGLGSISGSDNTFIGTEAGWANTSGNFNTLVGKSAGAANGTGIKNSILGSDAGIMLSGGQENVLLGHGSANSMTSGNRNVFIGNASALSLPSGSDNIFIGNLAGALINSATDNTLIIENSNSTTPLIWGDFTNDRLGINRQATTNALEVEGEASKTTAGSWVGNSDARLKKNIKDLNSEEILQKLLQLQGVNYEWNDTQTGAKRPEGIQYGFIAQNIQKVFPDLVKKDNLGYLQTAYGTYDAMQIEALRALLNRIENLENENLKLKTALSDIKTIKTELAELKGMAKK